MTSETDGKDLINVMSSRIDCNLTISYVQQIVSNEVLV